MRQISKKFFRGFSLLLLILCTVLGTATIVFVCTMPVRKQDSVPSVCLDPGHGAHDSGATSGDRKEKDDNLRLALAVRDALEAKGIRVYMTRDNDTFLSLEERCNYANRKKCNLFVSLHRNSATTGQGIEIWIKNTPEKMEWILAETILNDLEQSGHITKARGVKTGYRKNVDGNYFVNAHTKMPSCLAEIGFVTSEEDNALFDTYLSEYAEIIANAIVKTLQESQSETAS